MIVPGREFKHLHSSGGYLSTNKGMFDNSLFIKNRNQSCPTIIDKKKRQKNT